MKQKYIKKINDIIHDFDALTIKSIYIALKNLREEQLNHGRVKRKNYQDDTDS